MSDDQVLRNALNQKLELIEKLRNEAEQHKGAIGYVGVSIELAKKQLAELAAAVTSPSP
jgi:hypothetical protein